MTTEELENYEPKGQLIGFPKEIIARMLECQEEQCNKINVSVFEKDKTAGETPKGIIWRETKEGFDFWSEVIRYKNFALFFARYPKKDNQDNSQEFRIGDKVIDIITRQIGKILEISTNDDSNFPIYISFNKSKEAYTLDGRYSINDRYPRLLHYRDDYDYSIIDFNNLPERQEPKRWRAEEEGVYSFVGFDNECWFFSDDTKDDYDTPFDNNNYNLGNYFQTKEEAQEVADKLNEYFQELINPNK